MKTYIAAFMLLLSALTFAQEKNSYPKYALSFGIGENFKLTTFNMDFTFKKVYDEDHQLRIYLSPDFSNSDTDQNTQYLGDDIRKNNSEQDNTFWSLGLGSDYLWTIIKEKGISLFGGPGIYASYYSSSGESISNAIDGNVLMQTKDESDVYSLSAGTRGVTGVEWKVRENIGIHCEYVLNLTYQYSKIETAHYDDIKKTNDRSQKLNDVTIGNGVLFGLSIYL